MSGSWRPAPTSYLVIRARNDAWRLGWMAALVRPDRSHQLAPVRVGAHAKRRAQADLDAYLAVRGEAR